MSRPKKIAIPFDQVPQYPREAFLTAEEVARALRVSVKTIIRADLPTVYLGKQTPRYHWGTVCDTLIQKAS